ncbi:MAG: hypothetical protein ABI591_04555 [Kofleriaceae bacterium]
MPRWQRAFVIAACALIGAGFTYAACDWGQWPRISYLPISGDVVMKAPPGSVVMTYFGIVAWGLGGAICGSLIGAMACAVIKKPLPDRALQLAGAWAITAILLAGSYYTWTLWPW